MKKTKLSYCCGYADSLCTVGKFETSGYKVLYFTLGQNCVLLAVLTI